MRIGLLVFAVLFLVSAASAKSYYGNPMESCEEACCGAADGTWENGECKGNDFWYYECVSDCEKMVEMFEEKYGVAPFDSPGSEGMCCCGSAMIPGILGAVVLMRRK